VAVGGHGTTCIEDAMLGWLSLGSFQGGPAGAGRTPAEGVRHCHPPEAAWAAATNLPGLWQRHWRHPRRYHSEDSLADPGSPERGMVRVGFSPQNGASAAVQVALSNIPVSTRAVCSFWALGRCLRAAVSRTRDGITTPGCKAPRSRHFRMVVGGRVLSQVAWA